MLLEMLSYCCPRRALHSLNKQKNTLESIKNNYQKLLEANTKLFITSMRSQSLLIGSPALILHQYTPMNCSSLWSTNWSKDQGGSLCAGYQRLAEPGFCRTPLPSFLEIHRDINLMALNLRLNTVQLEEVSDNTHWNEFFTPGYI
jgi:hypothetical protein